jgi:hypothetical protein
MIGCPVETGRRHDMIRRSLHSGAQGEAAARGGRAPDRANR